jgi:hypothetical protein
MKNEWKKAEFAPSHLQYSNNPDGLLKLLNELEISYKVDGVRKYFTEDESKRLVVLVSIKREDKEIIFDYGMSLFDTTYYLLPIQLGGYKDIPSDKREEIFDITGVRVPMQTTSSDIGRRKKEMWENFAYHILSSVPLDYYVSKDLEEWCDEYGYSSDSISNKEIWERCLKQSSKLEKIFTPSDIELLPQ